MIDKDTLGMNIRHTSKCIKNYVDKTIDNHFQLKLTGIEGMTIGFIHHQQQQVTAKDVMDHFSLSKATVSQTLSNLEKKKVIRMEKMEKDTRKKELVLTDLGNSIIDEFERVFKEEINPTIEKGLTENEKECFKSVLEKILINIHAEKE